MLVIHPIDRTTAMLSLLYEGKEVRILNNRNTNAEVKHELHHTSRQERILLLGHGSPNGLLSKEDDTQEEYDRLLIQHQHAFYLRQHQGNLIGIWCYANLFAVKEGLHGLFSGMIISEMREAVREHIKTSEEELERENIKLAQRLRTLLDEAIPLCDFPQRMAAFDDVHSPLTEYNYHNFYYL